MNLFACLLRSRTVGALAFFTVLSASLGLQQTGLAAGVTVITHGFQMTTRIGEPDWLRSMGLEIAKRAGGLEANASMYRLQVRDAANPRLAAFTKIAGPNQSESASAEAIILVDWAEVAGGLNGLHAAVRTREIAEIVARELQFGHPSAGLERAPTELPIHLIGHSRGGSVMAAVARLLGEQGIWVDHLTLLDPHPVDGICEPLSANWSDESVTVYSNVRFADNYWRRDSCGDLDFDGQLVIGAYDGDLNGIITPISVFLNPGDSYPAHQLIHAYYHGTINLSAQTDIVTGGSDIPAPVLGEWYSSEKFQRQTTGFAFSRILGGERSKAASGLKIQGGLRESVNSRVDGWDNVEIDNMNQDISKQQGDVIGAQGHFEDLNNDASIWVGLDNNSNPYDGILREFSASKTTANYFNCIEDTARTPVTPGAYFVYAKISNNDRTRTRYHYATGKLTVNQPQSDAPTHPGELQIYPAIEVILRTAPGFYYQLQSSTDLKTWIDFDSIFLATNQLHHVFASQRQHRWQFFRANTVSSAPVTKGRPVDEMVWLPPGTFMMGSPATEIDRQQKEGPQRRVTISQGFWMFKYEVSLKLWSSIMPVWGGIQTDMSPAAATWFDANTFCVRLTEREIQSGRLPDGYVYRLPTEAEWEYAARAGTTTRSLALG